MRRFVVLVALAACDGPTEPLKEGDAGVQPDDGDVVMPDASLLIEGTWQDTFHTTTGTVTASACNAAPTAITVDQTTAAVNQYPGICKSDGTFTIDAPQNLGTYFLRVSGVLYETTKRSGIDLSTDRLGRNDIAAITGVTLDLDMTNLQTWTAADVLVVFGANIGYRQNLVLTSGTPAAGAQALAATANWNGYKIDGAKSDTLALYQLGKHTAAGPGVDFNSLDRVFTAPTLTMANNTSVAFDGAFTTATAGQVTLAIDVASFNQFANAAGPSVAQKTMTSATYASPSTDTIDSPPLISFAKASDGLSTVNFGTLFYSDPFPSAWNRMVRVQVGFQVPYTFNTAAGSLNAGVVKVMSKATAEAGTIIASVGPPTQVKFDGADARTATSVSQIPLVSWSTPTVGNASDYELQVYEVKSNAGSLTFTSVLRMITKQTSVKVPEGYLLPQRAYVFLVRARNRTGIDVHTTPIRNGASYSSADALSALVQTP